MNEVTRILSAVEQGDPHAAERLLPLVYDELRKDRPAPRLGLQDPFNRRRPHLESARGDRDASRAQLTEPGLIRSPDGKQIAVLLRESGRKFNSFVLFSDDEGKTWTKLRELPGALTGDRHTARYAPDGRLFLSFRDTTHDCPTRGDWVAWVGTYDDIVKGREGQYRVRLMKNHKGYDCAYPGVELLPDGTFVTTTYGHWIKDEQPYIVSVRLKLKELDERAKK